MALLKVVLDPKKWDRGNGETTRLIKLLHGEDGKMCCLGFAACKMGAKKEQIRGIAEWDEIRAPSQEILDCDNLDVLYEINDSPGYTTDRGRVRALNEACRNVDAPFRFTLKK